MSRKICPIDSIMNEYALSLIHKKPERKKRTCIKCGVLFNSKSPSNRRCSKCGDSRSPNERYGKIYI